MDKNNVSKLEYYIDYSVENLNYPKINFSFKTNNNNVFLYDWFKFVDYFNKLANKLDNFIVKCLINDYYCENNSVSARELISKIILNLNFFLFDMLHVEYFNKFDDMINRLKFLKKSINSYSNINKNKLETFVYFLVFFTEIIEEINEIFDYNLVFFKDEFDSDKLLFYYEAPIDFEFIPISGGIYQDKLIKSFFVSKNLISIYQFYLFLKSGGYNDKSYWSEDGFYWVKYFNIKSPKNWICIKKEWYVDNYPINSVYNLPVTKISFYEAEACANFYNCKIQNERERDWLFTNRNKTICPTGIDFPYRLDMDLNIKEPFSIRNNNYTSLMGINQLFGNVWEFTSSTNDINEVIVKGGDFKTPSFLLNSDLKLFLVKSFRKYNIGFRLIKY
mgnify:CR=1 FL=1